MCTIAKPWKELWCPSTDEGINKMWCIYIHTKNLLVLRRQKWCMPVICSTWKNLEGILLNKISQSEKKTIIMGSLAWDSIPRAEIISCAEQIAQLLSHPDVPKKTEYKYSFIQLCQIRDRWKWQIEMKGTWYIYPPQIDKKMEYVNKVVI